jgi:hypothetical protein
MSIEIVFNDMNIDNGYGIQSGDLVLEVTPNYTDERFTAHNELGVLSIYGGNHVATEFELDDAIFFIIDRDGGDIGQIELDLDGVYKLVDHETILREMLKQLD